MSDIPKAREVLEGLLSGWEGLPPKKVKEGLQEALSMMTRDYVKPRAPTTSAQMTPLLASNIRATYSAIKRTKGVEPSNQELADMFGVNPGRISEALARRV